MEKKKTPAQSYTEQVHLVNQSDLNGSRRLFGGTLLSWIDMTAGIVARRHAEKNVSTVAIDNLHFIAPAYANDLVVLCGKVTYAGTTSLEIRVDSFVEHADGTRVQINRAFIVMVALGEDDKPSPVPGVIPQTDEEKAEYQAAEERKKQRYR
ncbi:MAG: acyl-CoA thioesterase [Clostridia bacterium]|nr:acyl-CoA thioesterase [Clostridia bacterium]